jgi:hypothetical protein
MVKKQTNKVKYHSIATFQMIGYTDNQYKSFGKSGIYGYFKRVGTSSRIVPAVHSKGFILQKYAPQKAAHKKH